MSHFEDRFLPDVAATLEAGGELARVLADGAVVAIDGPLGAGKTTFVRGLSMALGVPGDEILSPSFTIVIEHDLPDGRVLRHVDAWRLGSSEDLADVGWSEWAGMPETLTVVEWASRVDDALPASALRLRLDYADASGRVLSGVSSTSGEMP